MTEPLKFTHPAMGSTFEVLIAGEPQEKASQAAEEVFREVDRIQQALSRYEPGSDVSRINKLTPNEELWVGEDIFACLKVARRIHEDTRGAFDPTIGPIMNIWRNPDKTPRTPSQAEITEARALVGMKHIVINDEKHTVAVKKQGVSLDLGAIGKGYALDKVTEILKDWEIKNVLLNSGDSTVLPLGKLTPTEYWTAGIGATRNESESPGRLKLFGRALSGSGVVSRGRHIMDPRTGQPVMHTTATWVLAPNATEADALSTAFFVMKHPEVQAYCDAHSDAAALILPEGRSVTEDPRQRFLIIGDWAGTLEWRSQTETKS